ncbi:MAG: hypothetical protein CEE43_13445 [Promethearchaeota archaeon Loki_b32]|nr:MAG: hypothetical protein CEE43_13445 [Candidatus Lokiarchaeota archaeon Loki_b32]
MNIKPIISDINESSIDKNFINESLSKIKNFDTAEEPLISIIIPMYNEEYSIREVIERIPNHNSYEIIVVDDGSTDNSVKKIKEIKERNIQIIQHEKNLGYGAAVLTGFKRVTGDIIVTMDSDGQHNPEEIPNLIKPIIDNQADFVVGSRYLGSSKYKVPLHARMGENLIKICLWFLYRQKVSNNQSGFRAFNSQYVKILKNIRDTKFGLCTETIFKAGHSKLRISEVPININVRQYGNSRVDLFKIFISISTCILIYIVKRFKLNRFFSNRILAKIKNKITILIDKFT